MTYKNRKHSLREAKSSIREDFESRRAEALAQIDEIREKLGPDFRDHPDFQRSMESYREIVNSHQDMISSLKNKSTLTWTSDKERRRKKHSKPRKQISWSAAEDMISSRDSVKKNNREWLSEGTLVVHKDEPERMMMVIEVKDNHTRALCDGVEKSFRTLSLRPAF